MYIILKLLGIFEVLFYDHEFQKKHMCCDLKQFITHFSKLENMFQSKK